MSLVFPSSPARLTNGVLGSLGNDRSAVISKVNSEENLKYLQKRSRSIPKRPLNADEKASQKQAEARQAETYDVRTINRSLQLLEIKEEAARYQEREGTAEA